MRAVRCEGGSPVVVEAAPAAGDGVKVRVASVGICGSDLHLLQWNLPVVMGHEFAGTTPDGTPVAVEPITPCGVCDACRGGDVQRCVLGPAMVFGYIAANAIAARATNMPPAEERELDRGLP